MKKKTVDVKVEELPACYKASARSGNLFLGYDMLPVEIIHWKEKQKTYWSKDPFNGPSIELYWDTQFTYKGRTYFYCNGAYTCVNAFLTGGYSYLDHVEKEPLDDAILDKYEAVIDMLEERVGKILIERHQ